MKRTLLKSLHKLQVLNDGSSFYGWIHPFKNRSILRPKDMSFHFFWDKTKKLEPNQETYLQNYTKSFISKIKK